MEASNSSSRVKAIFTGLPVLMASSASTGSMVISFLPPKPPPTAVVTTLILFIGIFKILLDVGGDQERTLQGRMTSSSPEDRISA